MFCIKINSANKVIIAFLLIEYLLPYSLHSFVNDPSYMYYQNGRFSYLLLCFFLSAILPLFMFNRKKILAPSKFLINRKYLNFFIITYCCVVFLYNLSGLTGSRYFGKMSELPNFNFIKVVTQISFEGVSLVIMLLLWSLLLSKNLFSAVQKKIAFLTIFSTSGINSAISSIYPICKGLLFRSTEKKLPKKNYWRNIKTLFFVVLIFFALFFLGLYIKSGQDSLPLYKNYFSKEYLVDRFSTHLYHLSSVIYLRASKKNHEIKEIYQVHLESIGDRYNLLMSNLKTFKEDRDKSISGYFNYYFSNEVLGPPGPGGSSIGLFATMVLIFPLKIVFFVNFLIFFIIKKCLIKVFKDYHYCSWLMAFSFAYGPLRIFTDDPLVWLNPFEPNLVFFMLFLFLYKKIFNNSF